MDIRYSCNQKDFKRYTTEEMRDEMLITGLYKADEVVAVYSHVSKCAMPTALVWQTLRHLSQRMQRARNSASGRLPGGRTRDASDTVE